MRENPANPQQSPSPARLPRLSASHLGTANAEEVLVINPFSRKIDCGLGGPTRPENHSADHLGQFPEVPARGLNPVATIPVQSSTLRAVRTLAVTVVSMT